jgi:hypothetical protein
MDPKALTAEIKADLGANEAGGSGNEKGFHDFARLRAGGRFPGTRGIAF